MGLRTAAYQVEGGARDDGRGPSNWDVFSHTPGKTYQGDTGDVADDSYHRYKEDVQLLRGLGVQTLSHVDLVVAGVSERDRADEPQGDGLLQPGGG